MSDLIDREEAIEWVANWVDVNKYYHPYSKCNLIPIDEVIDRLQNVPSAEKTGKWIEQNNHDWEYSKEYRCSECGKYRLVTIPKGWNWNYCPNCGARMVNDNE